ncbi:hypothetical protein Tco_1121103 [Tanacetum coccineum]|uniref:Uncharacterized protein n=1 Tax=Tanacetum coccineum TaxID=301880 RepID=A0ABQ5IWS5_9ASTR
MPTEMELTLEQTQQGVSYEVSKDSILLSWKITVKKILLKLNLSDHSVAYSRIRKLLPTNPAPAKVAQSHIRSPLYCLTVFMQKYYFKMVVEDAQITSVKYKFKEQGLNPTKSMITTTNSQEKVQEVRAKLADADRLQVGPLDEDEDNQCIRLLSCCKRHSPNRSIERVALDERMGQLPSQQSDNVNPSGCAHTGMSFIFVFVYRDNRRGRKEPEALAAASLKRVYVENRPYLVGGFCQHDTVANINKNLMLDAESIVSMSEKYIYMRKTFRKTLAFATVLVVEENVKNERYSNLSKTLEAAKHEFLEWKRKYEVALSKQKAGEKQASSVIANLKARSSAAEARLTAAREQTLSAQEEAGEWKRKYDVVVKEAKSALEKAAAVQDRASKQTQIVSMLCEQNLKAHWLTR